MNESLKKITTKLLLSLKRAPNCKESFVETALYSAMSWRMILLNSRKIGHSLKISY